MWISFVKLKCLSASKSFKIYPKNEKFKSVILQQINTQISTQIISLNHRKITLTEKFCTIYKMPLFGVPCENKLFKKWLFSILIIAWIFLSIKILFWLYNMLLSLYTLKIWVFTIDSHDVQKNILHNYYAPHQRF